MSYISDVECEVFYDESDGSIMYHQVSWWDKQYEDVIYHKMYGCSTCEEAINEALLKY